MEKIRHAAVHVHVRLSAEIYCAGETPSARGMTAGGVCSFLAKKAKRLLIPYAVISSAVFLPKALLSVYAMHPVELSLSSYVEMLVYPDYNAIRLFWFLPTLFVMFCMVAAGAYILRVMRLKVHPLIILLVLLLPHVTPLSAGDIRLFNISKAINIHLLYFAAGYYFCKYGKMENFIAVHRGLVFGVTFVISIAVLLLPDGDVKSLLLAFNGIAMSFAIAHIYVGRKWSFLNPYFEASYAIYLFSWAGLRAAVPALFHGYALAVKHGSGVFKRIFRAIPYL